VNASCHEKRRRHFVGIQIRLKPMSSDRFQAGRSKGPIWDRISQKIEGREGFVETDSLQLVEKHITLHYKWQLY
jgi:hypothetical protein